MCVCVCMYAEVLRARDSASLGRVRLWLPAVLTTGSGEREESIPTRGNSLPWDRARTEIAVAHSESKNVQIAHIYFSSAFFSDATAAI